MVVALLLAARVNCAYPLGREVADVFGYMIQNNQRPDRQIETTGSRTASNWLAVAAIMTLPLSSTAGR